MSVPHPVGERRQVPAKTPYSARLLSSANQHLAPGTRRRTAGPIIRDAVIGDLRDTARLHIEELPVGLFPRLGTRFVARWHRAFVQSAHAVAGLEPVGSRTERAASSTSKSAVSRRFVAATETALAELLAAELSGLDLVWSR